MFGKLFPAGIFKPSPDIEPPKFGNLDLGYYGRIGSDDAVPFAKLMAACPGLVGVNNIINSEWMKYIYKGKTILIPRACPLRNVSRALVAGYANGKIVSHNGKSYHIWIMSGGSTAGEDSDYTRFIYPLMGLGGHPRWDNYTYSDIAQSNLPNQAPVGTVTANVAGSQGVIRGRTNAASWSTHPANTVAADLGWRPLLELIP